MTIKHHLRVELGDEETLFLIGEKERFMLHGRIYRLLGPLLDGCRTAAELAAALAAEASAAEVHYALRRLEERGYLAEPAPAPEVAGFWEGLGENAERAAERLAATPVSVLGAGGEDPRALADALAEAGIQVCDDATLVVLVTGDYLDPDVESWSQRALENKLRWIPVKPGGLEPWIGPVFRSGIGACWACLAHRLRHNRPVETYLEKHRNSAAPLLSPLVSLPASRHAALSLTAVLVARWIAGGGTGILDNRLVSVDFARMQTAEHPLTRRPQCPACGDRDRTRVHAWAPVRLTPRLKRFTDDGGHRAISPEETFARAKHLISPITGIVASLGPVEGRDHPLRPVYGAICRVCPDGESPSSDDFHRLSGGKGRTAAQARAGALGEAAERYCALFQDDEPLVRARRAELGGAGVHPDALQNFSEVQYRSRQIINAHVRDPRQGVPLPFDERAVIDWTQAWSLTHDTRRFLPAAYCFHHLPIPPEQQFCYFNPNGHAAGSCVEEAILQGFLELVERDAVALWWYNRVCRPCVDLRTFEEPYFDGLAAHYRSLGWRLWVLDVTTDLGIPTFVALARAVETGRFTIGFGCHLEARLGVQRALTELNQLFDPLERAPSPWDNSVLGDATYLLPEEAVGQQTKSDYSSVLREDIRDDVIDCVERANRVGLETLVIDQTRPDIGLSVVKVIVPGLRHFWPRFGPGRLYEAPVRLGWVKQPMRDERDLNPVHLFG